MPAALQISVQHSFGSSSQAESEGKRNQGIQIGKEEEKLPPVSEAEDMILYTE